MSYSPEFEGGEGCICLAVEFKYQQAFSRIVDYTFNCNNWLDFSVCMYQILNISNL